MKNKLQTKMKFSKSKYMLIILILILLPAMVIYMQNFVKIIDVQENLPTMEDPVIKASPLSSFNPEDFKYYKDITFNDSIITGTNDDFPVLFSLIDSDLQAHAHDEGYDIVFYNIDDSEWLEHEIESYEKYYTSSEARLLAWIKVPTVSASGSTLIRMYFGNSDIVNTEENPGELWNNYRGVWHLSETPIGSDAILDSTSHDYDGDPDGTMTADNLVPGKIGNAINFDGSDDDLDFGGSFSLGANAITVSFWMNKDAIGDMNIIDKFPNAMFNDGWSVRLRSDYDMSFVLGNDIWGEDQVFIQDAYELNTWVYVTCTYIGSTGKIFINGNQAGSDSITISGSIDVNNVALQFGEPALIQTGNEFQGELDEVRISNFVRLDDWIATEYTNQNDPSSFYSISGIKSTDHGAPSITFKDPDNNAIVEDQLSITATITDPEGNDPGVDDVFATIDPQVVGIAPFNLTMDRIGTTDDWTCDWSDITSPDYLLGDYRIYITAIDTSLNLNEHTEGYVTVTLEDTHAPTVKIDSSTPSGLYTVDQIDEFIEIIATIDDTKSSISEAIAMINASNPINISMSLIGEKWTCKWTDLSEYSDGDYKITIWAKDAAGNVNQTVYVILTIKNSLGAAGGGDGGPFMIIIAIVAVIGSVGAVGTYGVTRVMHSKKNAPKLDDKIVKLKSSIKETKSTLKETKSSFEESSIASPKHKSMVKKGSKKLDMKKQKLTPIPKPRETQKVSKILLQNEIMNEELKNKSVSKEDLLKKIYEDLEKQD